MYYSKSKNGFYLEEIHGSEIPADAVEISDDEHAALLSAQSSGKVIQADANGNPVAVDPPPPTPAQIIASLTVVVQAHLDAEVQTHGYDGILSACTYATSTNAKFKAEGQACVTWRDAVWSACYAELAAVQGGTAQTPTEAALIASLPAITWP